MADEDDYDFDDLAEFDDESDEDTDAYLDKLEELDDEPEAVFVDQEHGTFEVTIAGRQTGKGASLLTSPATKTSEAIRRPLMSGHCNFPQSKHPEESHNRCVGYSRGNPDHIFQPCPCPCHFPEERYECECGATLAEAPHYPVDEDGDVRYVHVDPKTGRMVDGECPR